MYLRSQGLVVPGPSMRPIECSIATPSGARSPLILRKKTGYWLTPTCSNMPTESITVEDRFVELVRQVIVVRDIAPRPRHRVVMVQTADQATGSLAQPQRQGVGLRRVVRHQEVDEVVEAAFLDG